MKSLKWSHGVWLAAYVMLVAGLVYALFTYRNHIRRQAEEMQPAWQRWVDDTTREQARGTGPVTRRVPASERPPSVVLMEEHFGVSLAGVILFATAIFVAFMLLVRGALQSAATVHPPGRQQPRHE